MPSPPLYIGLFIGLLRVKILYLHDMKYANRVQKKFFFQSSWKNRMTHFKIFVAVKRHRDYREIIERLGFCENSKRL